MTEEPHAELKRRILEAARRESHTERIRQANEEAQAQARAKAEARLSDEDQAIFEDVLSKNPGLEEYRGETSRLLSNSQSCFQSHVRKPISAATSSWPAYS